MVAAFHAHQPMLVASSLWLRTLSARGSCNSSCNALVLGSPKWSQNSSCRLRLGDVWMLIWLLTVTVSILRWFLLLNLFGQPFNALQPLWQWTAIFWSIRWIFFSQWIHGQKPALQSVVPTSTVPRVHILSDTHILYTYWNWMVLALMSICIQSIYQSRNGLNSGHSTSTHQSLCQLTLQCCTFHPCPCHFPFGGLQLKWRKNFPPEKMTE